MDKTDPAYRAACAAAWCAACAAAEAAEANPDLAADDAGYAADAAARVKEKNESKRTT